MDGTAANPSSSQVFYDPRRRRWFYVRIVSAGIGVAFLGVFSVLFFGIVSHPKLPALDTREPVSNIQNTPRILERSLLLSSPRSSSVVASSILFESRDIFPFIPEKSSMHSQTMAFFVNWDDTSFTSLKEHIGDVDELLPEWLHLGDTDGSIRVDDPVFQDKVLVFVRATRPNLRIVPLLNNFNDDIQDWDGERVARMLSSEQARAQLIEAIRIFVLQNHFSGIHIDFENIPAENQWHLELFMRELFAVFHPLGLEVSESIPVDDNDFRAKELSASNDFLVLMAYDEHAPGEGATPGAIAGMAWFEQSLAARFAEIPADKVVVGLGSYGYDWSGNSGEGIDLTHQEAIEASWYARSPIALDDFSLNPTFDYPGDDGETHHVWFLDAVTAFNQVSASEAFRPKGYALWRLGSEDQSIWKVLRAGKALDRNVAIRLETLASGYDIDYEGQGEILKVLEAPKLGRLSIIYDETTRRIREETVAEYPSNYVIGRWGGFDPKKIVLTFDDGPDTRYTPRILDILKQFQAPATFFVIGGNANVHQDLLKRIVAEGHEVGNHTFTHPNIESLGEAELSAELNATELLFEGILGRGTVFFRPPYAEDVEPETPEQVRPLVLAGALGYYTVGIHIDPKDWSSPGADAIVKSVVEQAEAGDNHIVLLHDGGGDRRQTVEALPEIITALRAKGYTLVSLSDMIGASRERSMPVPLSANALTVAMSGWAFFITNTMSRFFSLIAIVGLALGLARFAFLGTLALFQKGSASIREYRRKKRVSLVSNRNLSLPKTAVLIPAYNEERVIRRTVSALLRSSFPNISIFLVDDGSTDRTLAFALSTFGSDLRVNILSKKNGGKASALNFGLERIDADIVVTIDADTIFRKDTIERLVSHFCNPKVGAVAGNVKVGNRTNLLTWWQAIEYITSQNIDRRAFSLTNGITVVPGSAGAWRRTALLEVGGFSDRTLAEDADLTFEIIRRGYRVVYEERALAFTEAPDSVRSFLKQRFRWMYGTLQTIWRHRDILLRPRGRMLGLFSMPNIIVFQVFFPFVSLFMDIALIVMILWRWWQRTNHPLEYTAPFLSEPFFVYYVLFLAVDMVTAVFAFLLEYRENWLLLFWIPFQRFFYRQLLYITALRTAFSALKGRLARWGKFERTATVRARL